MNILKYIYKNEDGASSVLVMVMMIVLIAFGLAGFSLALSNERLADKKIAWIESYYAVESDANKMLAEVYQAIKADNVDKALKKINTASFNCVSLESKTGIDGYDYVIDYTVASNDEHKKYIDVSVGVKNAKEKQVDILCFRQWQDEFDMGEGFLIAE